MLLAVGRCLACITGIRHKHVTIHATTDAEVLVIDVPEWSEE